MILKRGRLEAEVLPLGAIVRSLKIDGIETLLRLEDTAEYAVDDFYLNPVIGRCANRIADGHFEIDGEVFQVSTNEGANTLHGGGTGWNRRVWDIQPVEHGVRLSYASPDGEMGFPGNVAAEVGIALTADNALEIVWSARTDRPTPVNLTHHLYFNLSGDPMKTVLDHILTLAADTITPTGPGLIPTGELVSVDGTPFDFRAGGCIGHALGLPHPQLAAAGGLDVNFVLTGDHAALRLYSPESGVTLEVETDQPGLQVYSGQGLKPPFVKHGALAIEPQGFPDAPNHPNFPNVILRSGEVYRRRAIYRLSHA